MADEAYNDAAMKAVARQARSLYLSLIEEGFTEVQAMELVKTAVLRKQ